MPAESRPSIDRQQPPEVAVAPSATARAPWQVERDTAAVLARMQPLADGDLAQVQVLDHRAQSEIRRWDWLSQYLLRIERQVYATWAQAGRWPQGLSGVIRFQLDSAGRLEEAHLHLASGEPALDRSLLQALSKTMAAGMEESQQLAALNFRQFRFNFNSSGKPGDGEELTPWTPSELPDRSRDLQ